MWCLADFLGPEWTVSEGRQWRLKGELSSLLRWLPSATHAARIIAERPTKRQMRRPTRPQGLACPTRLRPRRMSPWGAPAPPSQAPSSATTRCRSGLRRTCAQLSKAPALKGRAQATNYSCPVTQGAHAMVVTVDAAPAHCWVGKSRLCTTHSERTGNSPTQLFFELLCTASGCHTNPLSHDCETKTSCSPARLPHGSKLFACGCELRTSSEHDLYKIQPDQLILVMCRVERLGPQPPAISRLAVGSLCATFVDAARCRRNVSSQSQKMRLSSTFALGALREFPSSLVLDGLVPTTFPHRTVSSGHQRPAVARLRCRSCSRSVSSATP